MTNKLERKLTEEQNIFAEAVASMDTNISCLAVSGSGKTTALKEGTHRLVDRNPSLQPHKILVCAFGAKARDELKPGMPQGVTVKTLNGLGYGACAKALGCTPGQLFKKTDGKKMWRLWKDLRTEEGIPEEEQDNLRDVVRLVSVAKLQGIVPTGVSKEPNFDLLEDEWHHWETMIEHHDFEWGPNYTNSHAVDWARELLLRSCEEAISGKCLDFDDQIYYGLLWATDHLPKFMMIIVDESQDVSHIQRIMLQECLMHGGHICNVGDPRQAIYGFRGAATDSMEQFSKQFKTSRVALTWTFRCAKKIVAHVNEKHPDIDIKAPIWQRDGQVIVHKEWSAANIPEDDTAIICRNNKPLVGVAFALLNANKKINFKSGNLAAKLIYLLDLYPHISTVGGLVGALRGHWQEQEHILKERNRLSALAILEDKINCIFEFINEGTLKPDSDIKELKDLIRTVLKEKATGVGTVLATGHGTKGLEYEHVYFLDSWLIPHRYASMGWQKEQEDNLAYVIRTRAKKCLHYINTDLREGTVPPTFKLEDSE